MAANFLNYDVSRRFALPRRIAVATDLTDADLLLPYAISQARVTGAHLCLIHAIPPRLGGQKGSCLTCIQERNHESEVLDRLEDMQRRAHLQGVCCSIRWSHGEPAKVIVDALRQCNADRLIAGSQGRRHLREIMHGSVAKELMAEVRIPTLFVGPKVHAPADIQVSNILCLVPLEGEFEKLARFALLVGEVYQARITLMHVLDDADAINKTRSEEWARTALQSLVDDFGRREKQVTILVKHGGLVEMAHEAAEELKTDVLVLGTGSPAHATYLKDPLAYQLIATAGCPVYCYRTDSLETQPPGVKPGAFAARNR
jgi:nucleotide-binding universal stress UspA family protein